MSKGYPDYFGFSFFPSTGQITKTDSGLVTIASYSTETIFLIESKCLLVQGYFEIRAGDYSGNLSIAITADGEKIFSQSLNNIRDYYSLPGADQLVRLLDYDIMGRFFVIGLRGDIPIMDSYKVELTNTSGASIMVTGRMTYSIVTS